MCGGCIFVVTLILNLLKNIVVFIVIPRFLWIFVDVYVFL
jgi:hypothetical protein